ncbi:MAG: hypothetical protein GWN00_20225, partial [Aliifodinibius sp.]|nr:hypothetical protein [candidate division Zixibacteria bacterium]NIT58465.1 hypothetical protein [Fodinibius sp.]NIS44482.1 hypothetical protein [candidate division Zixibacteria bacterium]NIU15031.1 hypothetical protein [candidate division Zixibacteria bacterium]NIV07050.1 hypothetical protein [candidate division Zixibacteria bacterium]
HQYDITIESEQNLFSDEKKSDTPNLIVRPGDESLENDVIKFTIRTIGEELTGSG